MLRLTNKSKIKSKRKGFLFQVLIGLGSLSINIFALYFIDILIGFIFQDPIKNYVRISLCSPDKLKIFLIYYKKWKKRLSF